MHSQCGGRPLELGPDGVWGCLQPGQLRGLLFAQALPLLQVGLEPAQLLELGLVLCGVLPAGQSLPPCRM